MDTIFITNDSSRAQVAEQAGVDRVMVDLEIIGKNERQKNYDTLISRHSLSDVGRLRAVLKRALLMVRINPVHGRTLNEVNACTAAGADIVMLPMISYPAEAKQFVQIVGGRSRTCLLIETGAALARLSDIISLPGIDEVHIGLNDLQVILSRDFNRIFEECSENSIVGVFRREIEKLHSCIKQLRRLGPQAQASNSQKLKSAVAEIVGMRRDGKNAAAEDTVSAVEAKIQV